MHIDTQIGIVDRNRKRFDNVSKRNNNTAKKLYERKYRNKHLFTLYIFLDVISKLGVIINMMKKSHIPKPKSTKLKGFIGLLNNKNKLKKKRQRQRIFVYCLNEASNT